jgi:fucose permease
LSEVEVGNFGSLVFLGLAIGSFIAAFLFQKLSYKFLIIIGFIGNGMGHAMFGIS